jgi:hypothetical protein
MHRLLMLIQQAIVCFYLEVGLETVLEPIAFLFQKILKFQISKFIEQPFAHAVTQPLPQAPYTVRGLPTHLEY